jgi:uroporphyrinogen-III synthase
MPEYKRTILSTRPVNNELVKKARAKGIQLDILPFIETEPIHSIEVQQEIELAAIELATVVFTSMNAVESVTHMLDGHIPEWRIYCMGHKTKELVKQYFGAGFIAGSADNASELADEIINNRETEEVIFFCGNQRRDELPLKLAEHDIPVNEVPVYQTILIPHKLEKKYDGVLFFSPSAAESFFTKNVLPELAIVFAIGSTTQETVASHCSNKIVVSKLPGKDALVEQAIDYFEGEE